MRIVTARTLGSAFAATLAVFGVAWIAFAQPAPPTATASAPARVSASAKASAAPTSSASATASGSAAPSASSAPSMDEPPPLDPHGGNPHGADPHGGNPHGGDPRAGRSQNDGDFTPPEDQSGEDAELPAGTIVLTVVDKDGIPVVGLPVAMRHDHASVAKGDTHDTREATTDAKGEIRFDELPYGAAETYWFRAHVGAAVFALRPLQLGQKVGGRALLHVYDATEERDILRLGLQSEIRTSLREDVILVEQEYRIVNKTPVAWIADLEVPLPTGWKAFQTANDNAPLRIYQSENGGAVLRGTVPPGVTGVAYSYHVPLEGEATQSVEIEPFPSTYGIQIIAEASRKMTLSADQFSPAAFNKASGVTVLVSQRFTQEESGIPRFKMTLGGLPTRGAGSYVAVALALVAVLLTASYRWSRKGRTDLEPDTLKDLSEARDTLLDEIAALEIAKEKGAIGPKTYERSRGLLLDALARIAARIDAANAPQPTSK